MIDKDVNNKGRNISPRISIRVDKKCGHLSPHFLSHQPLFSREEETEDLSAY
jgi:hypothetical protein